MNVCEFCQNIGCQIIFWRDMLKISFSRIGITLLRIAELIPNEDIIGAVDNFVHKIIFYR